MLAMLRDVLKDTTKKKYAIPAFNIFGFEDAKACIDAAEHLGAPVILATNKVALEHIPVAVFGRMLVTMAEQATVPVVIHLDHGADYETVAKAIHAGYSSVMYDGSQLPIEENIRKTKEIVKLAHAFDIPVEAEVGSVAYRDKYRHIKQEHTSPYDAQRFAVETGVDCLAVSVGSLHRMEEQTAEIDFELIKAIEAVVDIPLVMHGATGISDENLRKLAATSFGKVNIGTALRMAFGRSLRKQVEADPVVYDRLELFPDAMEKVKQAAINKMLLLNSTRANTLEEEMSNGESTD
ncbi:class II fructose-bisphosphate aldolase [Oceanobacillus alkalisoli]|uniref:class II fructose-bisphosphate aldolase n=1 Tax=Oceanobacillus alkalisoli TaxID=2925113 RepID=UPI001EF0D2E8|nr:class II fructose-bisphosphate aldolase [Oceanobacillus alkalisoli]MCF3943313.1 class II fructose-bisphosphate aldolase family protein [Oceanobacillus alkalisoli]MCG5103810.1 class II fructose-bisphosphate aldolase family protein [Oceanobacillus alkalisoli]